MLTLAIHLLNQKVSVSTAGPTYTLKRPDETLYQIHGELALQVIGAAGIRSYGAKACGSRIRHGRYSE